MERTGDRMEHLLSGTGGALRFPLLSSLRLFKNASGLLMLSANRYWLAVGDRPVLQRMFVRASSAHLSPYFAVPLLDPIRDFARMLALNGCAF